MDLKVSRKETRYLPSGNVLVLMSSVYDLYPVFAEDGLTILDVEVIDDERTGLTDGNQYEEVILGDTSVVALMAQIYANVVEEGIGVTVTFESYIANGREYLTPHVMLTNAV